MDKWQIRIETTQDMIDSDLYGFFPPCGERTVHVHVSPLTPLIRPTLEKVYHEKEPYMEHVTSRTKPGETMTRTLADRESRLRRDLAKIEEQKKAAREKATGKTKARAYARTWLEALTATELRHELKCRGANYDDFDTMEEAINTVLAVMFVQEGPGPAPEARDDYAGHEVERMNHNHT
jgi:hypothetical protein